MKKGLFILLGFLVFLVLVILFFVDTNGGCDPPEKPNSVPELAVWKGDCDGGNWLELVSLKKDKVRFRIYRDWNGDLLLDADFKYENCDNFKITKSNWNQYIAYFGTDIVFYENEDIPEKCTLKRVLIYQEER